MGVPFELHFVTGVNRKNVPIISLILNEIMMTFSGVLIRSKDLKECTRVGPAQGNEWIAGLRPRSTARWQSLIKGIATIGLVLSA
jgi:hypothetical protein